jgi:hypothetical protein
MKTLSLPFESRNRFLLSTFLKREVRFHLVNETKFVHNILNIFRQFYLQLLHVSDLARSTIRRNNCIYTTLVFSYSVQLALWCVGSCTPDK